MLNESDANSLIVRQARTAFEREDIFEIKDKFLEAVPTEILVDKSVDAYELPTNIHGPPELQKRIGKLLWRFRHRFRRAVGETPAI